MRSSSAPEVPICPENEGRDMTKPEWTEPGSKYERLPGLIYPTHKCFDDAIAICRDVIDDQPHPQWHSRLRVVHAFILDEGTGQWYAHAWVELDGEKVVQKGIQDDTVIAFVIPKDEFYGQYKPRDIMRYSMVDVNRNVQRVGTSGPWNAKFFKAVHWIGGDRKR